MISIDFNYNRFNLLYVNIIIIHKIVIINIDLGGIEV